MNPKRSAIEAKCTTEALKVMDELNKCAGLNTEMLGLWIWISGNTKQHEPYLRSLGCSYSQNKQMWYWRSNRIRYAKSTHSNKTIEEIRNKYTPPQVPQSEDSGDSEI